MLKISDEDFDTVVTAAIEKIPDLYKRHLDNVAFIVEDYPTEDQRRRLNLYPNETLFGLYEGMPLPQRGGMTKLLPDKITIFKMPILAVSSSLAQLQQQVGKTVWHEVAHYYGLDHARIHQLEAKTVPKKGDQKKRDKRY
jgi:predicted Zn-dependent protease with MMP-like domain